VGNEHVGIIGYYTYIGTNEVVDTWIQQSTIHQRLPCNCNTQVPINNYYIIHNKILGIGNNTQNSARRTQQILPVNIFNPALPMPR
jgi:hypothetical protein